jgi:hypothetical protein
MQNADIRRLKCGVRYLFNDAFKSSGYKASDDTMISE